MPQGMRRARPYSICLRTLARQLHAAIGDEAQLRLLLAGNAHNIKHPLANIQSYLIYLKSQSQRPHEQAQLIIESTIPPLEENAAILMERIKEMLEIATVGPACLG